MSGRNYDMRLSNTPCKWSLGTSSSSPHTFEPHLATPKICPTILDAIGNTPIVRINTLTKDENITCEILAKCEFLNPGGSIKDRVAKRIISDYENSGLLKPGGTIIEPTSGNTGIGISMCSAVKGYNAIITLPDKMSKEKSQTMEALGAKVIRCIDPPKFPDPCSYVGIAERLETENPDFIMGGQYYNPSNPLAHYDHTAEEIIEQLDGKLDYIVLGAGTGGHLNGISRKLKEKIPNIKVIAVEPLGSIIRDPDNATMGKWKAEGMGAYVIPRACDVSLIDQWFVVTDQDSFDYARKLIRKEGLLVGGTSGSLYWAAVQVAKTLSSDKRILVLLPDSSHNYYSTFLNDNWMIQNGFMEEKPIQQTEGKKVRDLGLEKCVTCSYDLSIREVFRIMKDHKQTEMPVMENGYVVGVMSMGEIHKKIFLGVMGLEDKVKRWMIKVPRVLSMESSLDLANSCVDGVGFAVVCDEDFVGLIYSENILEVIIG